MKDFIRSIASLPRRQKQIVLVLMDICVLPLMMWLAYAIRLARPNVQVMQGLDAWYIYVGVVGILIFALLGIYRAIVRSFNEDYLLRILIGTFIQIVALYTIKKLNVIYSHEYSAHVWLYAVFIHVVEPCRHSLRYS